MSGKRVATSFLAAAMAGGTLSSAAFAENGTVDPADLNWEKPEETINISVYAGEGDQEEFLADFEGPGVIQLIWITVDSKTSEGDCFVLRDLIMRMYWDGEENPSVEVPLGDFFCCGYVLSYYPSDKSSGEKSYPME